MIDTRKSLLGRLKDDDTLPLHMNFRKYIEAILSDVRETMDSCIVGAVLKNQGAIAVLKSILKDLEPAREKDRSPTYSGGFGG